MNRKAFTEKPPDRTEKLIKLLRGARAPEPSPEYQAAFWPRLQEKIGSARRRKTIIHPLYYGGLAAAAAALVLWVTLTGDDFSGTGRHEFPLYTMARASCPATGAETDYICGPRRGSEGNARKGVNYVLPRITPRKTGRLEV